MAELFIDFKCLICCISFFFSMSFSILNTNGASHFSVFCAVTIIFIFYAIPLLCINARAQYIAPLQKLLYKKSIYTIKEKLEPFRVTT